MGRKFIKKEIKTNIMGIGIGNLSSEEIIRFYLHVEYQHKYCNSIERYYGDITNIRQAEAYKRELLLKMITILNL